MSICTYCGKSVSVGLHGIRMVKCKHWVHTRCVGRGPEADFNNCASCRGIETKVELDDPSSYNGIDYVQNPPAKSRLTKLIHNEPFIWFKEHKPIEWIVNDRGYGLHRLIASGISIDDFLSNGYTWDDLAKFKDICNRQNQALMALGCNAEHFRDYQHILPKIGGRAMVEYFGFHFPPNGGLAQVQGGANNLPWNAEDLIALQFTMPDLIGAGLRHLSQYVALTATDDDEIALGVTDEHIDRLEMPHKAEPTPSPPPTTIVIKIEQQQVAAPEFYSKPKSYGLKKKK